MMRKLFISSIHPHLDYCFQLWAPKEGPLLDKLENILYFYTKLVPELRNLDYDQRLRMMRLTSVQRRYDRYRCIYVRKCLLGMVSDNGIKLRKDDNSRNGCIVDTRTKKGMNSLRVNSFSVRGPDVFNSLPKDLRELQYVPQNRSY